MTPQNIKWIQCPSVQPTPPLSTPYTRRATSEKVDGHRSVATVIDRTYHLPVREYWRIASMVGWGVVIVI
jgi:hypothetical protein